MGTYSAFKSDLKEQESEKAAKEFCEFRLNYNYENFGRFMNWIDGSDNAAREYLEIYNINHPKK